MFRICSSVVVIFGNTIVYLSTPIDTNVIIIVITIKDDSVTARHKLSCICITIFDCFSYFGYFYGIVIGDFLYFISYSTDALTFVSSDVCCWLGPRQQREIEFVCVLGIVYQFDILFRINAIEPFPIHIHRALSD